MEESAAAETATREKREAQREDRTAQEVKMPTITAESAEDERVDKPAEEKCGEVEPAVKGLKLCLTFKGCEVEIWADSVQAAVKSCEYALKMLQGG